MHTHKFALIGGIVLLVTGVLSFVPAFFGDPSGLIPLSFDASYTNFLGYFPMNLVNKVALIVFGAMGIAAALSKYRAISSSVAFSRAVAIVMIPAAILGLIPATRTFGGYWPLYSGEVLLHGVFGVLGAYFGWRLTAKAKAEIEPLLAEGRAEQTFADDQKKKSKRVA